MTSLPPGPLHRSLARLEGAWEGEEEVFSNPWGPGGPARGRWEFRFDRAGLALIHDFSEERSGGYRFDAHGVLTVDPAAEEIVWFWFDSYGWPPLTPSRGAWEDDRLVLEKHTPRGIGRSVFTVGPDRFTHEIESRPTGQDGFVPVMRGVFHRPG
ncbi:DUF1579 domain-containing protein [Mycobacterium sp. KBS0706]|uniref:DUF1579 family protein n=1 Tax=Mycobacterium sp. KBS0706 TaxID=2578109 RepID=UPI00110FE3E1|nr:DUF1579 family protein [Mycobacterium sp. KBS0706]TSD89772.1 DUF1579 domain-containing protein [Mycobacterium sp. KBS0706]